MQGDFMFCYAGNVMCRGAGFSVVAWCNALYFKFLGGNYMAVKKNDAVVISIPQIKIKEAEVTIVGDSSLLIHKFSDKAKREILEKQMKKAKVAKDAKNPVADFFGALHWLTPEPEEKTLESFTQAIINGAKFGFPSVGVKQSAISAAYRAGLSKNKVSLQGVFHIEGEFVEITGNLGMREDYCKIPMGGADIVYRGEFTNWESTFKIKYDESVFSLDQIIQYINYGGFAVGIGDWRPEKGGNFGMFHVKTN
jgi:hypothetical protein